MTVRTEPGKDYNVFTRPKRDGNAKEVHIPRTGILQETEMTGEGRHVNPDGIKNMAHFRFVRQLPGQPILESPEVFFLQIGLKLLPEESGPR